MPERRPDWGLYIMLAGFCIVFAIAVYGVVNGAIWDHEPAPHGPPGSAQIFQP